MNTALHPSIATTMRRLLALYGVGLCVAGISWYFDRSASETPSYQRHVLGDNEAGTVLNRASYKQGARVRVSSWDPFRSHHPLFAIDEMTPPTREAKWQSEADDRAPWLEVHFAKPIHLREVQLDFAGVVESPKNDMRDYRLLCKREASDGARDGPFSDTTTVVTDNRESRAIHLVDCPQTTVLRVEFALEPLHQQRDRVRLYEIRALGEVH